MRKLFSFIVIFLALLFLAVFFLVALFARDLRERPQVYFAPPVRNTFPFESIDTMKYSRDPSREKLGDPSYDAVIETQVSEIAETGATHIGIATPYDAEFLPMLERWVAAARRHNLHVWFRGNWSGWEEWFGYARITREEHLKKTEEFILKNPSLFEDGDVFSSCPKCENGGPGDPRQVGDVNGYRRFLIDEYEMMQGAFQKIHKNVQTNFFSMNGDVARLIMDKPTTKALGGIVTIDHYVETPEQLAKDVEDLARQSGGRIVLGEYGAPIPDIHGKMTEKEQAEWIDKALFLLSQSASVAGVNYWTGTGGSTEVWDSENRARQAVGILRRYYNPRVVYGTVTDELGRPLSNVEVAFGDDKKEKTGADGRYAHTFLSRTPLTVKFSRAEYVPAEKEVIAEELEFDMVLEREHKPLRYRLEVFLYRNLFEKE